MYTAEKRFQDGFFWPRSGRFHRKGSLSNARLFISSIRRVARIAPEIVFDCRKADDPASMTSTISAHIYELRLQADKCGVALRPRIPRTLNNQENQKGDLSYLVITKWCAKILP